MKKRVSQFTISSTKQSVGLCMEHYTQIYSHLHADTPCDSCGAKPEKWEAFKRHCPSPTLINDYLSHISTETSSLTASSTICTSCYKYFQSIVQQLKSLNTPTVAPTLHNIDTIATTLSQQIQLLKSKGQNIDKSEFYEMVMCLYAHTLIKIC